MKKTKQKEKDYAVNKYQWTADTRIDDDNGGNGESYRYCFSFI